MSYKFIFKHKAVMRMRAAAETRRNWKTHEYFDANTDLHFRQLQTEPYCPMEQTVGHS